MAAMRVILEIIGVCKRKRKPLTYVQYHHMPMTDQDGIFVKDGNTGPARMTQPRKRGRVPRRIAKQIALLTLLATLPGCHTGGARLVENANPVETPPIDSGSSGQLVSLASFQDVETAKGEDQLQLTSDRPEAASAEPIESTVASLLVTPALDLHISSSLDRAVPSPAQHSTSLEELVANALASHPSIAAARQRVAAAQHRIPQATALDDPILGNTFWPIQDQALQTAGGRVGHQFSLTQKVPWLEKLDTRETIAVREVHVAMAEIARAETEITEAVRLAYYELWLADELIQIVDDNSELVEDLIIVSKSRYKTGGSQRDVLRAELERDRLSQQLISLRQQKEQARADLGALVRQPLHLMPIAVDDLNIAEATPKLDQLVGQAEACNPTLQGLAAEITRDRAKEALACLQKYPDFQVGLGYSIVDDDYNAISPVANGHDNINFTVGMTLPVWRDKINAGIREAAHNRSATKLRRDAEHDKIRGTLRRQVAAADAAIEQLELFRERLIPRTTQTLEITTADYQGKKADFTDLIATYRELLTLEVQVARTKATLASTLAKIERTVGCP